jgi:surface antigen
MSPFRRNTPMQKARWSTAVAAAALIALPVAAFAQAPQSTPPQNPPAQQAQPPSQPPQQPPTEAPQQPPAQPPAATTTQQPPAAAQPAAGRPDPAAAKAHLTKARDSLSAVTSMPEAAKLQGETRTKVSQLISDFNALIAAESDWRSAYAKVDADLTSLLGAEQPADQPVGTSGSAALDPAIRSKLVELRTHLKAFESAVGGPSGGAMPPSAPTPSTTNPADPASPASTAGVSASSPTASMEPADRAKAESQVNAAPNADAQKELEAISAILDASKTGSLTRAQTTTLKKHVETLRVLLAQR